jgi:Domain of unknown function (DUF1996)
MLHRKSLAAPAIVSALLIAMLPNVAAAHDTADESDSQWQILCTLDHQRSDDPIVHPGHPGDSHMHSFYGNTTTRASSTTRSLMAADSSCGRNMQTSDHSAYWVPALYKNNSDGTQTLVRDRDQLMFIYYVRAGGPDGPKVKPFPPGLRMIAGNDDATSAQSRKILEWTCGGGGPTSGKIPTCSDPDQPIHASLGFPSCWDGMHLDSADHKSHMAYAADNGACPRSHPVSLPKLSYEIDYPGITGGSSYALASGGQYSMHGDFFAAWDNRVQNALVSECLNDARNCQDINRDGNILFKPASDGDPIPPINLANFSSQQTKVRAAPTTPTPTPTPTAEHKHPATPTPSPSASPTPAVASIPPTPAAEAAPINTVPAKGVASAAGGALVLMLVGYLVYAYRVRRRSRPQLVNRAGPPADY